MTAVYDVAVVGGGIHGTGVAQAAAAAGYSVLLIEKSALAAGTSSKSSKLIHGGLRYLETYHFGLVAESLRERALLLRLAPQLVRLRPFYIPVYETTRRPGWLVRAGLSLYAVLGRFGPGTTFRALPKPQWGELDGLRTEGLSAVFRYHDAQTDDSLLTRAVMASAQSLGAELAMPAELTGARITDDEVELAVQCKGAQRTVRTRMLVNAAGPWINEVLARVVPAQTVRPVTLVQGSHLVIDECFAKGIYYVESPRDGRAVFVMPRDRDTLVGTTEVRFNGSPDRVSVSRTERNYLLSVLRHYFPRVRGAKAVIDEWAGLRVLPVGDAHAFHLSRETILQLNQPRRARLLSIYGGKLTAYRATAAKVIRKIAPFLPRRTARADTRDLTLERPADD